MRNGSNPRRPLDGEHFDVAVVGGGINGVAVARLCAAAGRRTLLVEQNDFASGATSRSTRIIHGGLRYLEHGEISLVRESLRERERLLRTRPHLVRPLRFVLALAPGERSALKVRFGLWLYHRFAGAPPTARNGAAIAALERSLDSDRRWSIFTYDDAQCEFPERLVAEWLLDAIAAGAETRNHTQALAIETARGRVRGLRLRDQVNGAEFHISAPWVINAGGPWADAVARRAGISHRRMIGGVRGSHLVLPRFPGAPEDALYTEALDGRPIFVVPWNGELLVGTTEVADSGDPSLVQPSQSEISYLLGSMRRLFPAINLGPQDVRYAMAGVRPLPFSPGNSLASIPRRHLLRDHAHDGIEGMISVVGGKLATAMCVARECARKLGIGAAEPQFDSLLGCGNLGNALDALAAQVAGRGGIGPEAARATVDWFGPAALEIAALAAEVPPCRAPLCDGSPHVVAEAVYALRHECAMTLADVLLRRVPLALAGWWSEEHTRQAAARIGTAAGWSRERVAREAEEFEAEREKFLVRTPLCAPHPAHA